MVAIEIFPCIQQGFEFHDENHEFGGIFSEGNQRIANAPPF